MKLDAKHYYEVLEEAKEQGYIYLLDMDDQLLSLDDDMIHQAKIGYASLEVLSAPHYRLDADIDLILSWTGREWNGIERVYRELPEGYTLIKDL